MTEILIHAIEDTAILIPVLLVVHLLIELFEVKKFGKLRSGGVLGGPLAPLVGTGVGLGVGVGVGAGDGSAAHPASSSAQHRISGRSFLRMASLLSRVRSKWDGEY